MEFHPNDPQEEIDLKLKILHIYNSILIYFNSKIR